MADVRPLALAVEDIDGDDGGMFRILRVDAAAERHGAPVVLVHGMFTDRRFWLSAREVGLAAYLARTGHPVTMVQRRGLSDSPHCTRRCGLVEHLTHDLPVVARRIARTHDRPAFWVGHSFGGVLAARAIATRLPAETVGGLVLLASQYHIGKRMLDRPGNLATKTIARILGHLPARAAGLGPVDEPAAAVFDACDWVERRHGAGFDAELARIHAPVLAMSGAADRVDPSAGCRRFIEPMASPDKTFQVAGRRHGFEVDYDHPGIVVAKPARGEIWPRIAAWLTEHGG
ncbi:alpha/beta hydrolase [Salinisphaera sp. LB1]|uniref:alpha/beta hydrolase n=1 Tax=Salinisphaera sp. LB1 TaxID=2183911 RepID=UPI000D7088E6|nr:alpha/beta fold hydrolase [Salinisphaera sp. LB1]AWN15989.1 Esterase/lipase/thioesterase family protein [Salinisphaera sp. LB1]